MFNPKTAPYAASYYLSAMEDVGASMRIKLADALVASDQDIEEVIARLGREPGAALIVMTDGFTTVHRKTIIAAASRYRIPAVYSVAVSARDGGLMSYGAHVEDLFRRTAGYVDRILRGADPADLPVQLPTRYELIINLKTANALGLKVPQSLLLSADELIE